MASAPSLHAANMQTYPMYTGAYAYGRVRQNPKTRRVRQLTQRLAPE